MTPRMFMLITALILTVRLPAQQPWPGAGSNPGSGGRSTGQSGQGFFPVPPPPPPPPVNPVFPDRGSGRERQGTGTELSQPLPPSYTGENQQPVVTESLLLAAAEAYPGGDRTRSVADTISHIFYTAYSDQSRSFTVVFKNGPSYSYYLRNPRSTVQMGPDTLRVTYDTVIQAGNQMINGFFFSEAGYTNGKPSSLVVVNSSSGAAVVVMTLREAQP
ncbi:MAG: hypothetical protein LBK40_00675 [Spirochaetaceae bacterium]|nr:hypothetical protein [Spirochaetaceae bacterium]